MIIYRRDHASYQEFMETIRANTIECGYVITLKEYDNHGVLMSVTMRKRTD